MRQLWSPYIPRVGITIPGPNITLDVYSVINPFMELDVLVYHVQDNSSGANSVFVQRPPVQVTRGEGSQDSKWLNILSKFCGFLGEKYTHIVYKEKNNTFFLFRSLCYLRFALITFCN